jgi:SAM-dependent methyltransferase
MPIPPRGDAELLRANRQFYNALWSDAQLIQPQRFNTWPLVRSLLPLTRERLEVAPGLRPRLPIEGTRFLDISAAALARLRECGASVVQAPITSIPFPDRTFDLVCALDVVEHVEDEHAALTELSRVAAPGAAVLLSVPLHPSHWTAFDEFVGHRRRYEPKQILAKLSKHGIGVERSAVFGMQPRSSRLVDVGMWWFMHHRELAMWWYNRIFVPLGLRFQSTLTFVPGMIDAEEVDGVLLVCRKA